MTDLGFDAELRGRLERLSSAVPVNELSTGGRDRVVPGGVVARQVPSWRAAFGIAIVLVVAVAIANGLPRSPTTGASPSPSSAIPSPISTSAPSPTADSPAPATPSPELVSTNSVTDGTFELVLSAAGDRFTPNEPIEIIATLAYMGPLASIEIGHGGGSPISFGVVEPVIGRLQLTPGWDSICERSVLDAGSPLRVAFQKSGSYSSSDPQADEYRAFMTDPELRLVAGFWHVVAEADLDVGDCGGEHHRLRAEITIAVDAPGASGPTAAPTAGPQGSAAAEMALRRAPADLGCDAIGVPYRSVTFRIDPASAEPVTAIANTGTSLLTYWSAAFSGVAATRSVVDAAGRIVAVDGETLAIPDNEWPRLSGYFVCLSPNAVYVLESDPT